MSILPFTQTFYPGDVDPTSPERHFIGGAQANYLDSNCIHKIQEKFCELGFEYMVGNINGCYNTKLASAVCAFQEQATGAFRRFVNTFDGEASTLLLTPTYNGHVNGILDEATFRELNIWLLHNFANSCPSPLTRFGRTWVQQPIAAAMREVIKITRRHKGYFPENAFACFRSPANVTISSGMIKNSLHHLALAIDLDEWRGMQNPHLDRFFISSSEDNEHWNVHIPCADAEIPETTHTFMFFRADSKTYYECEISGRFLDLTAIFKSVGLTPIRRKEGWTKNYYLTEWWHFQLATPRSWTEEISRIGYSKKALSLLGKTYQKP